MKSHKLLKKAKASARSHYVRKKEFAKLEDEVKTLRKALARLERDYAPKETPAETSGDAINADSDDLKIINGIGPVLERKLNGLGITRFAQIAAWSPEDVEKISANLDFKGRIEREEWVRQAQGLSNP
ncbi:MAG: hypothetical protein KDH88_05150 [Chromatiales bacterium]|nr:hypothetical protein [Chromatiales bacterium]